MQEIPNLCWNALPTAKRHGWFCEQCGIFMKLYPISHDSPATHWSCENCKKNVIMSERDQVFESNVKIIKEQYELKTLEYSKGRWNILSSLFVGDNRISAKRKPIGLTERNEILNAIQEGIQSELHISFENWDEYFNEG